MSNISLRIPESLAQKLRQEMRLERRGRSEILREALERYLAEQERARIVKDMVQEARALYGNADQVEEARQVSEDFRDPENELLQRSEDATRTDPPDPSADEAWWK